MKIPFNWINWQQVLLDDPRPSFYAKALGLFLHTYMNNTNDIAFPSVAVIRKRMNIGSNSTVSKYTTELVELGYLVKEKRYGKSVKYIAKTPDFVADSITSGGKLSVLHDVDSSITPDELTVLHDVSPNNQMNNQVNNQVRVEEFDLPDNLNIQAYADWSHYRENHRTKKVRESWTLQAKKLTINKLAQLTQAQQRECVDLSIMNGWQGLFPDKLKKGSSNAKDFDVLESIARFGQSTPH